MFQGYNFMPCDYSLRTVPRRPLKTQMCLRLSHTENIEIYYIFSFLFYLHYYKYMLLRRHATIADYLTTIRRLFRDCPATIPGTRREPRGNLRVVLERACRLSGWQIWQQERRAAVGGAGSEGSRQRRGPASAGAGGGIKAARGIPLFAPELPFKRTFAL